MQSNLKDTYVEMFSFLPDVKFWAFDLPYFCKLPTV